MAKTKVLNSFTRGAEKFLDQNAGISNIIVANITSSNVEVSIRVNLPEGSAYLVKDFVISTGQNYVALDNQLLQTSSSKIGITTDTTSGIEVVYTAL
tara:strand:+ start:95 stop:385 length:291 start_codon:yes stop_codon:yes gene_type:complete